MSKVARDVLKHAAGAYWQRLALAERKTWRRLYALGCWTELIDRNLPYNAAQLFQRIRSHTRAVGGQRI